MVKGLCWCFQRAPSPVEEAPEAGRDFEERFWNIYNELREDFYWLPEGEGVTIEGIEAMLRMRSVRLGIQRNFASERRLERLEPWVKKIEEENLLFFCNTLERLFPGIPKAPRGGDIPDEVASVREWLQNSREIAAIRALDLSRAALVHLPPEIRCFQSLRTLNFSRTRFEYPEDFSVVLLPRRLLECGHLEELSLSRRPQRLPGWLGLLNTLRTLNCSGMGLRHVDPLQIPPNLQEADFSENPGLEPPRLPEREAPAPPGGPRPQLRRRRGPENAGN